MWWGSNRSGKPDNSREINYLKRKIEKVRDEIRRTERSIDDLERKRKRLKDDLRDYERDLYRLY